MSELNQSLAIVNFVYLMLGVFYSWQIYLAPSPHGWTWISVAVGTLILILGMMFNTFLLLHFDALTLPNSLLVPVVSLALAGLPMTAGQAYKKYREDRDNKRLMDDNG